MLQDVARELHKLCAYLTKTMSEIKINCIRNVTKMYADFYDSVNQCFFKCCNKKVTVRLKLMI